MSISSFHHRVSRRRGQGGLRGRRQQVQVRTPALLLLVALVTAWSVGACGKGNSQSAPSCTPGQSIACTGDQGCPGHQLCALDGTGYLHCDCSVSDGGRVQNPGAGPNSGLLGAVCQTSADCHKGLECLGADSKVVNGEGPSAGICIATCAVDHSLCTSVDATSKCVVLWDGGTPKDPTDDAAYCLPGCKIGTPPKDADKCRGRVDLVCSETTGGSGVGLCRPACRSDVDCSPRYCDLATGLCGDAKPSGDPIGATCDPANSKCAGGCTPVVPPFTECSAPCSYGTAGCGQDNQNPPLNYFCFLDPTSGTGAGDLGYCVKLCGCDNDCGRPDAVCEPRSDLYPKTGRAGVCGPKTYASGGLRPNRPCQ